jgi:ribosomal protein S18 acetylase RimI-like enzyme
MALRLRAMTEAEFGEFRVRAVSGYADAHVEAGDWEAAEAQARAEEETSKLLPTGLDTAGMVFTVAEVEGSGRVGHAWVNLDEPDRPGAWIFDIEIEPQARGKGYGRELLRAVEEMVRAEGVPAVGLNVFGANAVARGLYESAGYRTTSLHMLKRLD